jgi:DNA-binding transcriptional ArsR family regulator
MDAIFKALADPTRRTLLDRLFSEQGQISRRWLDKFSGERVAAILNLRDALEEKDDE